MGGDLATRLCKTVAATFMLIFVGISPRKLHFCKSVRYTPKSHLLMEKLHAAATGGL